MRAPVRAVSLPAPVGGWDTKNEDADMPPQNAKVLDNWFPGTDAVTVRRGYAEHATGLPGAVETLIPYHPPSGAPQLFAAAGGAFYNVTGAGAVGAPVATGFASDRWQFAQMTTPGGHFTLAVNGVDAPQIYNGTAWANATITGPVAANLAWINIHQRRLWFGEAGSLTAWYFPPNTISGGATAFPLTGLAAFGGSLNGMGTWTRDGGSGADDIAVFMTTEGEAMLYAGTDPAGLDTWGLQGVFRLGRPLGRRAMTRAGAELLVMTQDGFLSLSQVLPVDRAQQAAAAITDQINSAVTNAARIGQQNFGWQAFVYPTANMLIFNVPATAGQFEQYVFNTLTRAPCRFTGIPARCWGLLTNTAYFGGVGAVYRFDTGTTDNGATVRAYGVQAFNGFGSRAQKKAFKRLRVLVQADATPTLGVDLALDYKTEGAKPALVAPAAPASGYDSAIYDASVYAGEAIFDEWRGVAGMARTAAIRVLSESPQARPSWIASDVLMVPGGLL